MRSFEVDANAGLNSDNIAAVIAVGREFKDQVSYRYSIYFFWAGEVLFTFQNRVATCTRQPV